MGNSLLDQYRTILFDVNGTLLGYEDPLGSEKRLAEVCRTWGKPVTAEDVHQAIEGLYRKWSKYPPVKVRRASTGEQYRQVMTWFYQELLIALEIPGDSAHQAELFYDAQIIQDGFAPPFPEVKETLEGLRARGFRLGILSNFPPHLEDTLKQHGLRHYFDFFVISSLVGLEKPDREIFELAIERAGCPKQQIVYVGDNPEDDVRGAHAVGLDVILVDRFDLCPDADCLRIKRLSELLTL